MSPILSAGADDEISAKRFHVLREGFSPKLSLN